MRGLIYLEWRYAVHQVVAIVRSPMRLILWALYSVIFGAFLYGRAMSRAHGTTAFGFEGPYTEILAGVYAGAIGFTIAFAGGGRVFAFRNAAEAVLLCNAGIRPRAIALWLQVRKLAASGGRWFAGVAYLFLLFAPRHATVFATLRAFVFALLAVSVQMSVDLPAFLVARGRLQRPVVIFGGVLAAAGFGFAALAAFANAFVRPVVAFIRVDPGSGFTALLRGNAWAVLALVGLLAALALVVAILGDDSLPELYAASRQTLAARHRATRGKQSPVQSAASSSARRIPAGAFTLVWKDWISFRRGRGSVRAWLAGCLFAALCGVGAAVASRVMNDWSSALSFGATATIALLVLVPSGASMALASDLGKPLFWLSRAPLRTRIVALTAARTWRLGFAIGLAPSLAAAVAGNVPLAATALPAALAIYWSLQSLGIGLFALFPNPLDSRGPMAFVRTIATAAYAALPVAVAVGVAMLRGPASVAILACAAAFVIEGWIVIELATLRFAESGATLATISRAG